MARTTDLTTLTTDPMARRPPLGPTTDPVGTDTGTVDKVSPTTRPPRAGLSRQRRNAADEHGQRFDWAAFLDGVGDFQQLRDSLPEDETDENRGQLFEVVDSGGWAETRA